MTYAILFGLLAVALAIYFGAETIADAACEGCCNRGDA